MKHSGQSLPMEDTGARATSSLKFIGMVKNSTAICPCVGVLACIIGQCHSGHEIRLWNSCDFRQNDFSLQTIEARLSLFRRPCQNIDTLNTGNIVHPSNDTMLDCLVRWDINSVNFQTCMAIHKIELILLAVASNPVHDVTTAQICHAPLLW